MVTDEVDDISPDRLSRDGFHVTSPPHGDREFLVRVHTLRSMYASTLELCGQWFFTEHEIQCSADRQRRKLEQKGCKSSCERMQLINRAEAFLLEDCYRTLLYLPWHEYKELYRGQIITACQRAAKYEAFKYQGTDKRILTRASIFLQKKYCPNEYVEEKCCCFSVNVCIIL